MDVEKPKGLRLKKWQKKQLWFWRLGQRSSESKKAYEKYFQFLNQTRNSTRLDQDKKKKLQQSTTTALSHLLQTQASFLKYCRRLERYAKKGQLRNGQLYCKAGIKITHERVNQYEAMCHFMVRKFLPGLGLWEAGFSYDDLINQLRMEIYLALANGFDPFTVMEEKERTIEEIEKEVHKLESVIVCGRLKSYLRRQTWKFHPDQLGGKTWCIEEFTCQGMKNSNYDKHVSREFSAGLFTESNAEPLILVDFIRDQQDRLLEILDREGPDAVKKAFFALDTESRDVIQDSLFGSGVSRWNDLTNLGGDESCNSA